MPEVGYIPPNTPLPQGFWLILTCDLCPNLNGRVVAVAAGSWIIRGLLSGHLNESPASGEQKF